MPVYLIAGASRGIGLEIVRQLASNANNHVVAAARSPETAIGLQDVVQASEGRVATVKLDFVSEESISDAVNAARQIPFVEANGGAVDVLVLNAGIGAEGANHTTLHLTARHLRDDMNVNFVGSALVTIAFVPLLQKSQQANRPAKILFISSASGSAGLLPKFAADFGGLATAYASSKSAANHFFRKLALELADGGSAAAEVPRAGGWAVGLICPGSVKTDNNPYGELTPEVAVARVLKTLDVELTAATTGSFWGPKGELYPF